MKGKQMKFGLEREYFIGSKVDENERLKLETAPWNLPCDACGFLAEARSKPYDNIREAVYSLFAEEERIVGIAEANDLKLYVLDYIKLTKEFKHKVNQQFEKGLIRYSNLYGHLKHSVPQMVATAGVHVSVTNPQTIVAKKKVVNYNGFWNFPLFIKHMDKAFKDEIKAARRKPGFYELKYDGRFEYRSLPASIDLKKVIEVIDNYDFS
jgi:hypothetical protein